MRLLFWWVCSMFCHRFLAPPVPLCWSTRRAELQLCCHPDSNDLITWEAFLLISMCEDVSYNPQDVENLREEFKRWDPDGNGYIDLLEMRQMMKVCRLQGLCGLAKALVSRQCLQKDALH